MYLLRAFLVWLLIILVETIHGTLRQIFLAPAVGDFPARRIAVLTGMLLIFLIAYLFIHRIGAENAKQLFAVGLLWAGLTLLFELGLGVLILNYSRERMLEDYDVSRGGFLAFGLVFMIFAPYFAAKFRGVKISREQPRMNTKNL